MNGRHCTWHCAVSSNHSWMPLWYRLFVMSDTRDYTLIEYPERLWHPVVDARCNSRATGVHHVCKLCSATFNTSNQPEA